MDRDESSLSGIERAQGADLHPRHESWARISVRSTFIGFLVFLALLATFVLWIELRY